MQAQSPQAPYIGIWTRTTSFRRRSLERQIVSGAVLRATVMRQTLHLVTRRDYGVLRSAMSATNFPWEEPGAAPGAGDPGARGGRPGDGRRGPGMGRAAPWLKGHDARRAWRYGRVAGHVLHHHESALWGAVADGRFVAIEEPERHDPTEARAEMPALPRGVRTGVAPRHRPVDVMHVPEIDRALERLEPLRRFRDEGGRELLDVPRAPIPDADTIAPVRFLPGWDNVLLAFADRTRILPEAYRKTVIKTNGDVAQTFLVDGVVAGIWRVQGGRVVLEPFEPLPRAALRELQDEAARLETFLAT